MSFYEDLVMQTQMNYSRYYSLYAAGKTPYQLAERKPVSYTEQIATLLREIKEADCVIVGGASGLSAAGGGDFFMRTMLPTENISADMQRNIILKALLTG